MCIDGLEETAKSKPKPKPKPAAPPEKAPEPEEEPEDEDAETSLTGNDVVDGILLHSQQRMLAAIEALSKGIDTSGSGAHAVGRSANVEYVLWS